MIKRKGSNMINLEKEINKWKKSLRKHTSLEEGNIKELEAHLRDAYEIEIRKGKSSVEAFRDAKDALGECGSINNEYRKSHAHRTEGSKAGQMFAAALWLSYLKVGVRNLTKNKSYSLINIGGLAIGILVCAFIALFINNELSYDNFHKDGNRIYRVVKDFGGTLPDATTPPALAPALYSEIPEVEESIRIMPEWDAKILLRYGDASFYESNFLLADSNFFSMFTVNPVAGDLESALIDKNSIVITESLAKKYFGDYNPIGSVINAERSGRKKDLTVTAVVEDYPENAHFDFDFIIHSYDNIDEHWGWYNFYTYIKLKPNINIANVDPKIQELYEKNWEGGTNVFYSQPISDIHLHSNLKWELGTNGSINQVNTFAIIAIFVLIIAAINYINLATARSALRAKEVGIRKVSGAFRFSLIKQFLIESVITSVLAFIIAVGVLYFLLPTLNELFNSNLILFNSSTTSLLIALAIATILVGIISGIYPALYLSKFQPVVVLKDLKNLKGGLLWLRKGLIVTQFTVSAILIIGTLAIRDQLNFIREFDWGIEKNHTLVLRNTDSFENRDALRNELLKFSSITEVGNASTVIGELNWTRGIREKGKPGEEDVLTNFLIVDENLLNVLNLKMIEGRKFSEKYPSDLEDGIILSRKAIKELEITEPAVGKQVVWATRNDTLIYRTIVGVTSDFYFSSLREEIKPFAFVPSKYNLATTYVKLAEDNYSETIEYISEVWKKILPNRPMEYSFLDDTFAQMHKQDAKFSKIIGVMTSLAIVIALMGLFALTAYTVERKTKEIGIRKVLGASVKSVVVMISADLLKLVVISIIVAIPTTWLLIDRWLEEFAYKTELTIWTFILGSILTITISIITISYKSIKAATANPTNSLKYE